MAIIIDDEFIVVCSPESNHGGQSCGCVTSTVQVTHAPTQMSVTCGVERSQVRNKLLAMIMLERGLKEIGWKSEDHE
jgi:protein subunit release factor A